MQKTIGGDRLGSGKKMKVDLHGYERSTHDLGYIWRSTMAAGTLVPFLCEVALPGDTFDINLGCDIKTHPTIGPLFGSYKTQLDVFQAPIRLYSAMLHNNQLGIGLNMASVKLPKFTLLANPLPTDFDNADLENSQVNPSCLLAYLGIRGVGNPGVTQVARKFNAVPLLAYWEIYKNYYANKQEEIGAVIHTELPEFNETVVDLQIFTPPSTTNELPEAPTLSLIPVTTGSTITVNFTGAAPIPSTIIIKTEAHGELTLDQIRFGNVTFPTATSMRIVYNYASYGTDNLINWRYRSPADAVTETPTVTTFQLSLIDEQRNRILAAGNNEFSLNSSAIEPYVWLFEAPFDIPNILNSQEGLGIKTYQSDLFNNWIQTEWIDGTNGITNITAIDTSGGSFTLDTLNLSKKVYDMLNRIAISGGSYDDWLDAVYTHDRYTRCESPMYMGGLIKELVFQEVVSNSLSEDQPLGTLAGKGVMAGKHKGGSITIKVDEPSYIIGIVSLTPRVDYSQGNKWDINLDTLDDLHKPALDEIGFQELITEQMAWWDTFYDAPNATWQQRSAGKQPAWLNYMTNVNQTRGNFAIPTNEMFMTLNRRYEPAIDFTIEDLTTYIDPGKFNFIFAQTSLDAQNFWAQISVDITARRKMSAKIMPNL